MPSSRYSRDQDDSYSDVRRERRSSGRYSRVQDVSYSQIGSIRERERAAMDQPFTNEEMAPVRRSRTQVGSDRDSQASRRTGRRDRYADDNEYDYRRSRRRESAQDDGGGDRAKGGRSSGRSERGSQANNQQMGDRDREGRGSGRSERGSQANNQQMPPYQRRQQQEQQEQQGKSNPANDPSRETEERSPFAFDKSSDGLITAAAGAALGAITARHFLGPKAFSKEEKTRHGKDAKHWSMIGGAVLGGIAANLAESNFHSYFEEKQDERNEDAEMGLETTGELIGAMAPDII